MIGPDLQQLAAELNIKVAQGVAYGIVNGYAATFSDGTGNHRVMLTTRFEKPSQKDALMEIIDAQDLKGLYGIKKLMIAKKVVYVVFRCGPEAPSHIRNFLDWLCPLLEEHGASKADVCVQCQETMEQEQAQWILRDGNVAFRVHKHCAEELKESIAQNDAFRRLHPEGSIGRGILGVLVAAVMGAVLWMILQQIGFMAVIAAMAIGWLVVFFYDRFGGKKGKVRLPILIAGSLVGILLGVVAAEIPALLQTGAGIWVLAEFWNNMRNIAAFRSGIFENLVLGIFICAFGLFLSVKNKARNTDEYVVTDLE